MYTQQTLLDLQSQPEDMKICPNCGVPLNDGMHHCSNNIELT